MSDGRDALNSLANAFKAMTRQGEWVEQAACRAHPEPDIWFEPHGTTGWQEAVGVCRSCPVQPQCLEWAVENNETTGLWGGMTPTQRRELRSRYMRRRAS